jgi:hypothetical protein
MIGFDEFVKLGKVKKVKRDMARAKSIIGEAEHRLKFYKKIQITSESANYIVENMYDVIREFIDAKLISEGYKTYSHEATVSYLKILGFSDYEVKFADELRLIRHKTKYYGLITDIEYAKKVLNFLEGIYKRLKDFVSF